MRLTLFWQGWDLLDLEVHICRRRQPRLVKIPVKKQVTTRINGRQVPTLTTAFGFTAPHD